MNKKTYGQIITEFNEKKDNNDNSFPECNGPLERDIIKNLHNTVNHALKQSVYRLRDFYVVMLSKKEIGGSVRSFFFARLSCPTPVYRQSVWKYHHISGGFEYLWTIPGGLLYHHIIGNKVRYLESKEYNQLAQYVIAMESGDLMAWVKKENGEKPDGAIKIITGEQACQMN